MAKKSPTIIKVLSITPVGRHAWVEAAIKNMFKDIIIKIRKPISEVPADLMRKFRKNKYV